MKNPPGLLASAPRRPALVRAVFSITAVLMAVTPLRAGIDVWTGAGTTNQWTDAGNWSSLPKTGDALVFGAVTAGRFVTSADISTPPSIDSITFTAPAPAYTISILYGGTASAPHGLDLTGQGLINDASQVETLINTADLASASPGGETHFLNAASAANVHIVNQAGSAAANSNGKTFFFGTATAGLSTIVNASAATAGTLGGVTTFNDSSTAGGGTITAQGSTAAGGAGGTVNFLPGSNAGTATFEVDGSANVNAATNGKYDTGVFFFGADAGRAVFTINGATASGAPGGRVALADSGTGSPIASTAGGATFTINGASAKPKAGGVFGGGALTLSNSSAGTANITVNPGSNGGGGGAVFFAGAASADTATIVVNAGGLFEMSALNPGTLAVGSLAGAGQFNLGSANLKVGSLNTDTAISGVLADAGSGTRGSLTKAGAGTLTLIAANTYGGGTTITAGTLLATNTAGSATGPSQVMITGGALAGRGIVAGPVVNVSGVVAPGVGLGVTPGKLTLGSNYQQQAGGTLAVRLGGTTTGNFDQLTAAGAVSLSGTLNVTLLSGYSPRVGDTFTLLKAASVTGKFSQIVSPGIELNLVVGATGVTANITKVSAIIPIITSAGSAQGGVGQPFTYQIEATNTATSYSASGLPKGLTIDTQTGVISGTPTAAGSTSVVLAASNSAGTGTANLNVVISATPLPTAVLTVTVPTVTANSGGSALFTVTLTPAPAGATPIIVNYTIKGSAKPGVDYLVLNGRKKFKPGKSAKPIRIIPVGDLGGLPKRVVKLTLAPGDGYIVGDPTPHKVKILAP